ncbi:MAG: ATP-binding protein [bacterium]|nr:ATP-binding protein [bacterium]
MKTMQADIRGLIRNTFVSTGKPLMPVFEAISNSFHAIEDAQVPNGEILITATREPSLLDEVEPGTGNIVEFVISDNGIGMNDENYEAFLTADTTYKQTRGGKGIGRFTWLVVFERAVISSKYVNNGECFERKFTFSQEGITHYTLDKIEACTSGTDLRLCLIKNKYQKYISRKRLDVIARFIL